MPPIFTLKWFILLCEFHFKTLYSTLKLFYILRWQKQGVSKWGLPGTSYKADPEVSKALESSDGAIWGGSERCGVLGVLADEDTLVLGCPSGHCHPLPGSPGMLSLEVLLLLLEGLAFGCPEGSHQMGI